MISEDFVNFINNEVLPHTNFDEDKLWPQIISLIEEFSPRNRALLEKRLQLQKKIDEWHCINPGPIQDMEAYKTFLQDIGYLLPNCEDFTIATTNADPEIASIAGPQLVVPLKNARFALNAANARWGSLYDALYGTDVIDRSGDLAPGQDYNAARGDRVISYAREFLDQAFPLAQGTHNDAACYHVNDGQLVIDMIDGQQCQLQQAEKFAGFVGDAASPTSILLRNNGLHVELQVDHEALIGKQDTAGINDIHIEAAISTIMDCEDSVAAVDPEDKIEVYRNWLGLMQGKLTANFDKAGRVFSRELAADRKYSGPTGKEFSLPGRSLLFNRNVGLLMTTTLVTDETGQEVPENIIDAVVTAVIGSIDLASETGYNNSRYDSIYIVKPKLHGPEEVEFTCDLFGRIESMLDLPSNTLKLGIMDEERRTSVNLKQCIKAAAERLVFINTGFLDRTGDEIHTSMHAGAFLPKNDIKQQTWIKAYENRNVAIGLACGLSGHAQIGKGMWAMPDEMQQMMQQKSQHPAVGATTAWIPSPTAAVLHALHYHQQDVYSVHRELAGKPPAPIEELITLPLLAAGEVPSKEEIQRELNNNIQGILGYVARWVEMGIGCSKVPDINNVELMEDRATLRISAKHVANWLLHGLCNKNQVLETMKTMAAVVDQQNDNTEGYVPMTANLDNSLGFQAALELVFDSASLPNGYTEPPLHKFRQQAKQRRQQS
jgi:malate synthase